MVRKSLLQHLAEVNSMIIISVFIYSCSDIFIPPLLSHGGPAQLVQHDDLAGSKISHSFFFSLNMSACKHFTMMDSLLSK